MLIKLVVGMVGLVVLSAVFEIIMPDGAFKKYVKIGVSSVFVLLVLSSLSFQDFDRNFDWSGNSEITVDEELVDEIYEMRVREAERQAELRLDRAGYDGVIVRIRTDSEGNYKGAEINLSDLVLSGEEPNINSTMEIRRIVAEFLGLDVSKVSCDEVERE